MARKIKLGENEYDIGDISDSAKVQLSSLQFATRRIKELGDMLILLRRARRSYVQELKEEILADKAGFLINDE